MDQPVDIDVALVNTTAINRDGTPRQEVLAECLARGPRSLYIAEDPRNPGVVGILVKRPQSSDAINFAWVGEFPPEYRRFYQENWAFEDREYEITNDGRALGMRVRGRFVPRPPSTGDQDDGPYDLTRATR